MNIFDREREMIETRLNTATNISDGERNILNRLLEILENNLEQTNPTEYIDKRNLIRSFPPLEDQEREALINPANQRYQEEKFIKDTMNQMVWDAKFLSDNERTRADDGHFVKNEVLNEYNRLYAMKQMISRFLKTKDYFDYYRLRMASETFKDKPISQDKYIAMMGRKPKEDEKFPTSEIIDKQNEQSGASPSVDPITDNHDIDDSEKPQMDTESQPAGNPEESQPIDEEPSVGQKPKDRPPVDENTEEQNFTQESTRSSINPNQALATKFNPAGTTDFVLVRPQWNDTPNETIDIEATTKDVGEQPEEPEVDLEDLVEVEKMTPWKRIKKHKKAILIGLGVAALAVAAVVLFNQILPAMTAKVAADAALEGAVASASKATEIAGLAGDMIKNGKLWGMATQAEQIGLHSANATLAKTIANLTGSAVNFDKAVGVWTFGTETLAEFAASSATTAQTLSAAAAKAMASATTAATNLANWTQLGKILSVSGLALGGTGLIMPGQKSKEYHDIKMMIDAYKKDIPYIDKKRKTLRAQEISNKIIESDKISNNERDILLRKLQRAIKKAKKSIRKEPLDVEKGYFNSNGKFVQANGPIDYSDIYRQENEIIDTSFESTSIHMK